MYVATDSKLGGLVAVKAMHEELNESRFADRFRREIRLMADFGHANILPILDSGEWDGRLFYVMKYVEGSESVRDRMLKQPGGLPIEDVLEMARGVCGALSYAHARGVLHRDVKPENILMSGRHAYLTDFGVAKALLPAFGDSTTSSGYVLGTQRYMSPEQEVADPHIDGRTDVWSLSCVIFEALTGLHPFNSPDVSRMRAMKVADRPESLRRHRPNVPPWLEAAVERGLNPNPADRWQSIDELAQMLGRSGSFMTPESAAAIQARSTGDAWSAPQPVSFGHRATPSGASASIPPADSSTPHRTRTRIVVGGLVIGAMASVAVAWAAYSKPATPAASATRHMLAVSVAALDTTNGALQEFARRISRGVTRELSNVPALRVLSSDIMDECRQKERAACREMLDARGVDTRLNATIDRVGDSLHVVLDPVDEQSKSAIPSLSLTVHAAADQGAIDRIATRLAIAFRQRLGAYRSRDSIVLIRATKESNALLGRISRERADADSLAALPGASEQRTAFSTLERADSLLGELIRAERRNASLWVERGWVALEMSNRNSDRRTEMLNRAIGYADSALAITANMPRAYELRGHAKVAQADAMPNGAQASIAIECDAERDLERAVAGDETLYRSWSALSWLRWSAGRTQEAKLAVNHAMTSDAYFDGGRRGLVNIFFVRLLLADYDAAREVCYSGHDLWPDDYKFVECQLTLMLYDPSTPQRPDLAQRLVDASNRLDSPEKARAVGNEYRALYRDAVAAIVSARAGDAVKARATLARLRKLVSVSPALRYDFSPQEATLVWELGDKAEARTILADWLRNRPDEVPNFRQDPTFRRMQLRDEVLKQAGQALEQSSSCGPA